MKSLIIMSVVLISIWFLFWKQENRAIFKINTFFEPGFKPVRGKFGLYTYCGKQGTGKTYSMVEYLIDNKDNILCFCNIAGIEGVEYELYTGFKELLEIKERIDREEIKTDKQIVIVYDEIFTELLKGSKLGKDVLDFLCQMRKRKIIFLTSAQEWAEIPLTFRRFCRFSIHTKMINFFGIGILIKKFGDAENMKWDNDQQEHICPIVETTISKCRIRIADSYDTFLRISSEAARSVVASTSTAVSEEKEEQGSNQEGIGITNNESLLVYAEKILDESYCSDNVVS